MTGYSPAFFQALEGGVEDRILVGRSRAELDDIGVVHLDIGVEPLPWIGASRINDSAGFSGGVIKSPGRRGWLATGFGGVATLPGR